MEQVQLIAERLQRDDRYHQPTVVVVLGSGLGALADGDCLSSIPYGDIDGFPQPTVSGHSGRIVFRRFGDRTAMLFQGRFHFYEGHGMDVVTLFPRLARLLNVELYVVTNAAGGLNPEFNPGDLMIIRDHLNLMGTNHDEMGPRFPDMTNAYNPGLRELMKQTGKDLGLPLKEGVYAGLTGPSYETPAEIRMLRTIGADAVGMSTVPEVIVARQAGLKVCGISCITNLAAGVTDEPLDHAEVLETGRQVQYDFANLIQRFLEMLSI